MNDSNSEFDSLLQFLRLTRGFDFTAYKSSTLSRRVQKRMEQISIKSYAEYQDHLELHPEEYAQLFNTILINVTGFFRDPAAWEYIAKTIVPRILEGKPESEQIRIWSAGCATGEEAYTLAMVFCTALGEDRFRSRVKIYATDADNDALAAARQATYAEKAIADIPPEYLEPFFETTQGRYAFKKELRRSVIFGRQDLLQDAPMSRIDLLVCRNAVMYFTAEAQRRVLARFYFALNENGFLFLGRSEMLLTHNNIFTPVDLRHRVFTQVPKANMRERLLILAETGRDEPANVNDYGRLREGALEVDPVAKVIVDATGIVVSINERARTVFGLATRDIGRRLADLEVFYQPVELRPMIDRAWSERRVATRRDVEWTIRNGETHPYDIHVVPIIDATGTMLGSSILFEDVARLRLLTVQLQAARHEVETATEELQSTNEELETTNEELQSSVEELETTNEELQSTNEELETMNEELQSTNEELEAVNGELRARGEEFNRVNGFLEAILNGVRNGMVVLDSDLRIQIWNPGAEELWGLRADEVTGKKLPALDFGLSSQKLEDCVKRVLRNGSSDDLVVAAINRRGKNIQCRITGSPIGEQNGRGVILMFEDVTQTTGA